MAKPVLERVTSGELTREQLKTLRINAENRGGAEQLIAAIDAQLIKLAQAPGAKNTVADHTVAERRVGYAVMASAINKGGSLREPKLVPVAEAFSQHPSVENLAILKTQIRFYYKGQHMVCGYAAKGGYWTAVLNDNKVSESTIEAWGQLGRITRSKYFANNSIAVEFADLVDVPRVMNATQFVNTN